jgi:hypothetical protein
MDISAFFAAYFSDWVGYVSGPGSVFIGLYGAFREQANHRRLFIVVAIICFFIAPIHIWTVEHRAKLYAEDIRTPRVSANITEVDTADTKSWPGKAVMIITLRLFNAGAQSVVHDYHIEVDTRKGKFYGQLAQVPNTMSYGNKFDVPDAGKFSLAENTANDPLPNGGSRAGILIFVFDMPLDDLRTYTKFVITFKDVLQQTYKTEHQNGPSSVDTPHRSPGGPQIIQRPSS